MTTTITKFEMDKFKAVYGEHTHEENQNGLLSYLKEEKNTLYLRELACVFPSKNIEENWKNFINNSNIEMPVKISKFLINGKDLGWKSLYMKNRTHSPLMIFSIERKKLYLSLWDCEFDIQYTIRDYLISSYYKKFICVKIENIKNPLGTECEKLTDIEVINALNFAKSSEFYNKYLSKGEVKFNEDFTDLLIKEYEKLTLKKKVPKPNEKEIYLAAQKIFFNDGRHIPIHYPIYDIGCGTYNYSVINENTFEQLLDIWENPQVFSERIITEANENPHKAVSIDSLSQNYTRHLTYECYKNNAKQWEKDANMCSLRELARLATKVNDSELFVIDDNMDKYRVTITGSGNYQMLSYHLIPYENIKKLMNGKELIFDTSEYIKDFNKKKLSSLKNTIISTTKVELTNIISSKNKIAPGQMALPF